MWLSIDVESLLEVVATGPILESKGMCVIFQKKGKKCLKRAKYLKIWAKMYKI